MTKTTAIINAIFALITTVSLAHENRAQCIPKNNLHIPISQNFSGITEEEFNTVMDRVEKIYNPIIESFGAKLNVVRSWKDDTVNAQAWQTGKTWNIEMFGGLARHKETTADGMMLVACHELGHHVGGLPKIQWASNEGQSDYYGSLKCLRKVWAEDNNVEIIANMEIPEIVAKQCETQLKGEEEQAICKRGAIAGMALGRLLGSLGGGKLPKFETPDAKVVKKTNNNHPAAQCRLDTYYAGAYCAADLKIDVSDTDAEVGVCSRKFGQLVGARPLCWYFDQFSEQGKDKENKNNLL